APNLMTDSYSWSYGYQVYQNRYDPVLHNAYGYLTFSDEMYESISENLFFGRMPLNKSEVLYYSDTNPSAFQVNDSLNLNTAGTMFPIVTQQVTIVGIISNLDSIFYQANYSADMAHWENYYDIEEEEFDLKGKFITKSNFFFEFINYFPIISSVMAQVIDVDYNVQVLEANKLVNYLQAFSELDYQWNGFRAFLDILSLLDSYQEIWLQETISIFLLSLPVLVLLVFLIYDISSIDKKMFEQTLYLFICQGLDNKQIRKIIALEKTLLVFGCISLGFLLGLIISIIILLISNKTIIGMNLFAGLGESLFIIPSFIYLIALFIGGFLLDRKNLKISNRSRSELFKRRRISQIRKIFSYTEVVLLFPSSLCIGIGFLGLFLSYIGDWSPVVNYPTGIFFISMIYIGFLLFGIIIFLVISKIIGKIWCFIGKKIWILKKNLFSFSLKNFSVSYQPFSNLVISLMIFTLAISPGLILYKAYPNHFEFEVNLRSGFSDYVISDWVSNQTIEGNIRSLEGVDFFSEVSVYHYELLINPPRYTHILVSILALSNVTEFVQLISTNEFLDNLHCSIENVLSLTVDDSYLMDYSYSEKNGYSKENILYNDDFTDIYYDRFPLSYMGNFKAFPLLKLPTDTDGIFQNKVIQYNLVMSANTLAHINSAVRTEPYNIEKYLLIKTSTSANLTSLKEEIEQQTDSMVQDKNYYAKAIDYPFLFWKQNVAILDIFLTIFIVSLISYFLARNLFQQQLKIIESSIRVGASKNQLLLSFIFEFIIAISVPLIISVGIGLGFLTFLLPMLFDFPVPYANFSMDGNWLYILWILPLSLPFILTYFINLLVQIRNFTPLKEE
ncbi:MAG: hypothetical protein ACFFDW_02120, partial [Candidatus Thorarchaeota archaeon]